LRIKGIDSGFIDRLRATPSGASSGVVSQKDFRNILEAKVKAEPSPFSAKETVHEYVVKPGDTLWKIGMKIFGEDPYRIAKENNITNPDLIYPGQRLIVRKSTSAGPQVVTASWYGKEYQNRPTASAERFNMYKNTLAHKTLPLGKMVRLVNPENGKAAVGKINDRGPFVKGRDVDLSYGLADELGLVEKGVGKLIMEIL